MQPMGNVVSPVLIRSDTMQLTDIAMILIIVLLLIVTVGGNNK